MHVLVMCTRVLYYSRMTNTLQLVLCIFALIFMIGLYMTIRAIRIVARQRDESIADMIVRRFRR